MLQPLNLSVAHSAMLEEKRAIPCELASALGVVSRGPHLAFEFRKNGVCMYRQVKREIRAEDGSRDKTFHIEPKGSALFFWNDDCLNDTSSSEILVITEGVEDALSWLDAGATHVVSVPNGTPDRPTTGDIDPLEDQRFAYLWVEVEGRVVLDPRVARFKKFILATDDDHAGRVLRDELAVRLGRHKCWWVRYPEGVFEFHGVTRRCKDTNEVKVAIGNDALMDMLADARPIVPSSLVKFSDIPETVKKVYSSGWEKLDPFFRLVRPELAVLTGSPGSGKSQFGLALCANLAWQYQMPGAILQFEDDIERNRGDLIRYAVNKQGGSIQNEGDRAEARAWMDRYFRTICPPELSSLDGDEPQNLKWLQTELELAAQQFGACWALLDPWNEIEHLFDRGETEAQYLNRAVRELKRLARRLQMMLFIVVHPHATGGQKSIEDASIYDIAGGAVWANKADHIGIVARDDEHTFLKIAKSKNHRLMGSPGTVKGKYRPHIGTYEIDGAYTVN